MQCPFCKNDGINEEALMCPYCKNLIREMNEEELARNEELKKAYNKQVIMIAALTIAGILIPLGLVLLL